MIEIRQLGRHTVHLDLTSRKVEIENLNLPKRQLDTLFVLIRALGRPVAKDIFFQKVWQGAFVEEGNLTQTIFLLRKALGKLPDGGDYIETITGLGYRLSPAALTHWRPLPGDLTIGADQGTSRTARTDAVPSTSKTSVPLLEQGTPLHAPTEESSVAPPTRWVTFWEDVRSPRAWWVTLPVVCCLGFMIWLLKRPPSHPSVIRITALTKDHLLKPVRGPLLLEEDRLLFTEMLDGKSYLAQVSVNGGEVTRRRTPAGGAWSMTFLPMKDGPSGLKSAQDIDRPVPADMSEMQAEPHPEGSLSGHSAAWSPDHKKLAFTRDHELLIADALGSNVHTVKTFDDKPYWPAWSPEGGAVRFTRFGGEAQESLWQIGVNGEALHPVLPDSPHQRRACCGSWSPDGRLYIYVVEASRSSALWIKTEPSALNRFFANSDSELISGPVQLWRSPLISRDNKSVYALGEDDRGELQQVSRRSGDKHAPYRNGFAVDTISFSHNGRWMAYTLYPQGTLWRSSLDGSDKVQLGNPGSIASDPQWSPDDKTILFLSTSGNHKGSVERVSSYGGDLKPLLPNDLDQGSGSFSPDGSHVAFGQSRASGTRGPDDTSIVVVDLVSGRSRELPSSHGLWAVRWSPNAEQLAAVTRDSHRLRIFDIRQQQWSQPTSTDVEDILWSVDGSALYFTSTAGPDTALYEIHPRSRHLKQLQILSNKEGDTFLGSHLSLGESGEILMMERFDSTEVYRIQVKLP